MPAISGVNVGGVIAPFDTADTYPVVDPRYGVDGLRSVADAAARNAVPAARRREGMQVYTAADQRTWRLLPAPWAGTNADWVDVTVVRQLGFNLLGGLVAGDALACPLVVPADLTLIQVLVGLKDPPVGASAVFDVKRGGTSLWASHPGSRPTVLSGATGGTTSTFTTAALTAGDRLFPSVLAVGSAEPGAYATLLLLAVPR